MTVSVLIPFAGDCPHRLAARAWVRARYAQHHPDWEVVEGTHDGPWVKARAVADALERSSGDVLVIADADVWTDGIALAVYAVEHGAPWAVPHALVHRLTAEATARVIAGAEPAAAAITGGYDEPRGPYKGRKGGGITVLPRATYERVPLDPRFVGFGQEDDSWAIALKVLAGEASRWGADLWHLWHPPQARLNRYIGNEAGKALYERYRKASSSPQAMRALIEEARRDHRKRDRPVPSPTG